MGYIHTTEEDFSHGKVRDKDVSYNGLHFDSGEVHYKVREQVAKKFIELEQEIDTLIGIKMKEFDNFLDSKGLLSAMGTIGKKEVSNE